MISKKGGAQNMSSDLFEEQSGLLCAVHAAHNAVGCDGDPALSRDAFRVSAESYLRDDPSGNYGCDEITDCFSSSQLHDVLCVGVDVANLLAMLKKIGSELCGFIMHRPGHWVALRRCGPEDADFQPAPLAKPRQCGVADCKYSVFCEDRRCSLNTKCDCISQFRCKVHKNHSCGCTQPRVRDIFRSWLQKSSKATTSTALAAAAKVKAAEASAVAEAKAAEEHRARADAASAADNAKATQAEEAEARAALKRQLGQRPKTAKKPKVTGKALDADGAAGKRHVDSSYLPDLEVKFEADKHPQTCQLAEFVKAKLPNNAKCEADRRYRLLRSPPIGKKQSRKKQGTRNADVATTLLSRRPLEFPGQHLQICAGQLYCAACCCNVGSAKSAVAGHVATAKHLQNVITKLANDANGQQLLGNIHDFEAAIIDTTGQRSVGSVNITNDAKLFRAEALREVIQAGIAVEKLDKLRGFLERRVGIALVDSSNLMSTFLQPIRTTELNRLREEVAGQDLGVYWDETTFSGCCMCTCVRYVTEELEFGVRCVDLSFLEASVNNLQISSMLIQILATILRVSLECILAFMYDSASPNIKANKDTLHHVCQSADSEQCCPHTGSHVGEHFETPVYDDFLKEFNTALATPGRARALFVSTTHHKLFHGASGRWWYDNDIAGGETCSPQ